MSFTVCFFVFVGQILKEIVVEDARITLQNGDGDTFPVKDAVHRGSLGVGRLANSLTEICFSLSICQMCFPMSIILLLLLLR